LSGRVLSASVSRNAVVIVLYQVEFVPGRRNTSHFSAPPPHYSCPPSPQSHSQSYFATVSQSAPLGLMTRFWLKSRQLRFCLSWASSLTEGRVCLITGHSLCLCWQYIHTYIYISFLSVLSFSLIIIIIIFFFFFIFLGLQSEFCTADDTYCSVTAQDITTV
jgi:hypothetical protein